MYNKCLTPRQMQSAREQRDREKQKPVAVVALVRWRSVFGGPEFESWWQFPALATPLAIK